jgi:hypothetical protein
VKAEAVQSVYTEGYNMPGTFNKEINRTDLIHLAETSQELIYNEVDVSDV